MNISNRGSLTTLSIALLTGFMDGAGTSGVDPANSGAPSLFYEQSALGKSEAHVPWLSGAPRMGLWKPGSQKEQLLTFNKLVLLPDRYSLLMAMDIPSLEDDMQAQFIAAAKSEGADAGDFEEKLAFDLLNAGDSTIGGPADGTKKFFDTGRKAAPDQSDSGTYDNLLTGALDATVFESAIGKLMNMADGKGRPHGFGRRGFNLYVGTSNRAVGLRLVKAQNLASGASNVNMGAADLIVSPYVSGTKWFLQAKTGGGSSKRPLIKAVFSKMRTRITDENAPPALQHDQIWWQLYTRLKAAYGDPQTIIGGPGA